MNFNIDKEFGTTKEINGNKMLNNFIDLLKLIPVSQTLTKFELYEKWSVKSYKKLECSVKRYKKLYTYYLIRISIDYDSEVDLTDSYEAITDKLLYWCVSGQLI